MGGICDWQQVNGFCYSDLDHAADSGFIKGIYPLWYTGSAELYLVLSSLEGCLQCPFECFCSGCYRCSCTVRTSVCSTRIQYTWYVYSSEKFTAPVAWLCVHASHAAAASPTLRLQCDSSKWFDARCVRCIIMYYVISGLVVGLAVTALRILHAT